MLESQRGRRLQNILEEIKRLKTMIIGLARKEKSLIWKQEKRGIFKRTRIWKWRHKILLTKELLSILTQLKQRPRGKGRTQKTNFI